MDIRGCQIQQTGMAHKVCMHDWRPYTREWQPGRQSLSNNQILPRSKVSGLFSELELALEVAEEPVQVELELQMVEWVLA